MESATNSMMRHRDGPPGGRRGWGPGRHIGFRIFGFLFFLLIIAAIIGGLFTWIGASNRGTLLLGGLLLALASKGAGAGVGAKAARELAPAR